MIREAVSEWFKKNRYCFTYSLHGDDYHWHNYNNLAIWIGNGGCVYVRRYVDDADGCAISIDRCVILYSDPDLFAKIEELLK